ncbi:MAG TPA: hypothetical protein VHL77_01910 [Ferruginibacter sp.]|nr:hypothetical protein [Ferruginibacter sp.]
MPLYVGYIRVERTIIGDESTIPCSFFSGNYNWLSRIRGRIIDLDWSELDINLNRTNIIDSFTNTSGVIFPLINAGSLTTRSAPFLQVEDFHPFIYLKDVMIRIFSASGLKLAGELLTDSRYQQMITSRSKAAPNAKEVADRSVYVGTETVQGYNDSSFGEVNFELVTDPYYVGNNGNFINNSQYEADIHMVLTFEWVLNFDISGVDPDDQAFFIARFFVNGVYDMDEDAGGQISSSAVNIRYTKEVSSGDVVEMMISIIVFSPSGPTGQTVNLTSGTMRVTPSKIYKVSVMDIVPDMTCADFVSQVLSMFNVVVDYDPYTKLVTIDLLKNVRHNTDVLDISDMVNLSEDIETDYVDFISTYGRYCLLQYGDSNIKEIEDYNKENRIPYAGYEIDSGNEFEDTQTDVLDLDILPVYEDSRNTMRSFLPKLAWRSIVVDSTDTVTTVNNVDNVPEFAANGFEALDLVRISESTIPDYNGDWLIAEATGTSFKVFGLVYLGNATLKASKIHVEVEDDNDPVFLLAVPNVDVSYFSPIGGFIFDTIPQLTGATAYFLKPKQGLPIDERKLSLAFGLPNLLNMHQVTMFEDYWRDFAGVVQDPVKKFVPVMMPEKSFMSLRAKTKIRLTVFNESAVYYISRFTGYKSSQQVSTLELVKIP